MNIEERIKKINKEDYFTSANLHTHSTYSDGKTDFLELIKQAEELGLKHLAISDHNTVEGWKKLNDKKNFLIPAVEFDCFTSGTLLHILGYGIDVDCPELKEICAKSDTEKHNDLIRLFKSRNPKKVIEAIHKANGIAVLAHPCCCWVISLDRLVKKLKSYGLDGIETYYPYKRLRGIVKFHSSKKIEKLAQKYNLIKTGGTDEHGSLVDSFNKYSI